MRLKPEEIAKHLDWFNQLKINPHPRVAGDLAIRALKDLQEIDKVLVRLHDEVYEGIHGEFCSLSIDDECDCGFGPICGLLGINS